MNTVGKKKLNEDCTVKNNKVRHFPYALRVTRYKKMNKVHRQTFKLCQTDIRTFDIK